MYFLINKFFNEFIINHTRSAIDINVIKSFLSLKDLILLKYYMECNYPKIVNKKHSKL